MKLKIFEVSINKKEPGTITVSFDEDVAERIGTKKVEEYSNEIVDILDRISKDL